jgi:hypothetical protein
VRRIHHADHAQALEDQPNPLTEYLVLALERLGERDRAGLPAGNGRLRLVFGQPQPALDAAGLGPRDVAGDALDLGVVIGVDDDLVVGTDQLDDGIDLAEVLSESGQGTGQQGQHQQALRGAIFRASSTWRRLIPIS